MTGFGKFLALEPNNLDFAGHMVSVKATCVSLLGKSCHGHTSLNMVDTTLFAKVVPVDETQGP